MIGIYRFMAVFWISIALAMLFYRGELPAGLETNRTWVGGAALALAFFNIVRWRLAWERSKPREPGLPRRGRRRAEEAEPNPELDFSDRPEPPAQP